MQDERENVLVRFNGAWKHQYVVQDGDRCIDKRLEEDARAIGALHSKFHLVFSSKHDFQNLDRITNQTKTNIGFLSWFVLILILDK